MVLMIGYDFHFLVSETPAPNEQDLSQIDLKKYPINPSNPINPGSDNSIQNVKL
jgi:hypothetical protein